MTRTAAARVLRSALLTASCLVLLAAGDGESGAGDLVLPVVAVGAAGALAAYTYTRRRRRAGTRTTPAARPERQPPLPELDSRAGRELVGADDAIRTSEEELGLASAQFGDEAARPFADALAYAKSELAVAFRLRQQLDDGTYAEDEATRRRMLGEIVTRCTEANRRLDAESASFDRLRGLETDATQALAAAGAAFRELAGRTGTAEATLTAVRQRYADSATAAVAGHAEGAKERLAFATASLTDARQAVHSGDMGGAAGFVRAAEGAVGQAATLIDAIDRRARELAEAAGKLHGELTETETDLADARALAEGGGAVGTAGPITHLESTLADVQREKQSRRYDPMSALRRVTEAAAALDAALTGAGRRDPTGRRARALLEASTLTARATTDAAADYVTTHRGAIGCPARTRLAEAQRHLEHSAAAAPSNAQNALGEAQQANALAHQAQTLAERDVRAYGDSEAKRGGALSAALLGGIILTDRFGRGPGNYGGAATRGRRGGGGDRS